jgi:hypothetical protein
LNAQFFLFFVLAKLYFKPRSTPLPLRTFFLEQRPRAACHFIKVGKNTSTENQAESYTHRQPNIPHGKDLPQKNNKGLTKDHPKA